VFDRPKVVENLSESDNLTYVGGDMFTSIPKADAVLLKVCFSKSRFFPPFFFL
jgi:isoflavone-7-O-methyltransferase